MDRSSSAKQLKLSVNMYACTCMKIVKVVKLFCNYYYFLFKQEAPEFNEYVINYK